MYNFFSAYWAKIRVKQTLFKKKPLGMDFFPPSKSQQNLSFAYTGTVLDNDNMTIDSLGQDTDHIQTTGITEMASVAKDWNVLYVACWPHRHQVGWGKEPGSGGQPCCGQVSSHHPHSDIHMKNRRETMTGSGQNLQRMHLHSYFKLEVERVISGDAWLFSYCFVFVTAARLFWIQSSNLAGLKMAILVLLLLESDLIFNTQPVQILECLAKILRLAQFSVQ